MSRAQIAELNAPREAGAGSSGGEGCLGLENRRCRVRMANRRTEEGGSGAHSVLSEPQRGEWAAPKKEELSSER